MGRLKYDFTKIRRGMGIINAIELILVPRILTKLGCNRYSQSNVIERFIDKNFKQILTFYAQNKFDICADKNIPNIIWIFWWQGIEQMPNVIEECYNSVLRNANGRRVILLTRDNYQEYIILPKYIIDKFQAGIISFPHFSDLVRVFLLKQYGGMWLDAAVYVLKPIPFHDTIFFSPKIPEGKHDTPHLHKWVIGVMAAPPMTPLFMFLYEILLSYWKRYDTDITYLMFDYFIRYGYEHFNWLEEIIDNRPIESPGFFSTRYLFPNEVDEYSLNSIIEKNTFISLTYRIHYPVKLDNGSYSYYSALLKKMKNNENNMNRSL